MQISPPVPLCFALKGRTGLEVAGACAALNREKSSPSVLSSNSGIAFQPLLSGPRLKDSININAFFPLKRKPIWKRQIKLTLSNWVTACKTQAELGRGGLHCSVCRWLYNLHWFPSVHDMGGRKFFVFSMRKIYCIDLFFSNCIFAFVPKLVFPTEMFRFYVKY